MYQFSRGLLSRFLKPVRLTGKGEMNVEKIVPCLWFDDKAQEAAEFYASVLPDTHIEELMLAPADYPAGKKGDVLLVEMTLLGKPFVLLNGGPYFTPNEAVSFQVMCEDQDEVDRYYHALSAHSEAEQCGWVKDKYGFSWQIVPKRYLELVKSREPQVAQRVMQAMLKMQKLDIDQLEAAASRGS